MEIKMKPLWGHPVVSRGRMAPVPVVYPGGFLAIFAAVFGATATPTLGELTPVSYTHLRAPETDS